MPGIVAIRDTSRGNTPCFQGQSFLPEPTQRVRGGCSWAQQDHYTSPQGHTCGGIHESLSVYRGALGSRGHAIGVLVRQPSTL